MYFCKKRPESIYINPILCINYNEDITDHFLEKLDEDEVLWTVYNHKYYPQQGF